MSSYLCHVRDVFISALALPKMKTNELIVSFVARLTAPRMPIGGRGTARAGAGRRALGFALNQVGVWRKAVAHSCFMAFRRCSTCRVCSRRAALDSTRGLRQQHCRHVPVHHAA